MTRPLVIVAALASGSLLAGALMEWSGLKGALLWGVGVCLAICFGTVTGMVSDPRMRNGVIAAVITMGLFGPVAYVTHLLLGRNPDLMHHVELFIFGVLSGAILFGSRSWIHSRTHQ